MSKPAEKQKLLLEYLFSSPDTYALCKSIVKAEYFDPEFRKTVRFLSSYYDSYNSLPSVEQVQVETNLVLTPHQITRDQLKYTTTEVEKFCRRRALELAVIVAPDYINNGDEGQIEKLFQDALSISLQRDLGLDYFEDPMARLETLASSPLRTPMGFKPLDDLMGGGLAKGEIILFCANSGGGKSITLANLAFNFIHQGKNVLYLTLELSQDLVAQRFDMMFTGIPTFFVHREFKTIAYKLNEVSKNLGHLTIKWMHSETNANTIRGYLKEYELQHKFVPDLLIVDYIDIMGSNKYVPPGDKWEKDKQTSEQLKDIGVDYGLFLATASQLNRAAIEAEELHQGHTAGGISKVNTVDWQWAIIQNPAMKAKGEMIYHCLKSRSSDAVGKHVYMVWDNAHLRILNPATENSAGGDLQQAIQEKKTIKGLPERSRKSLIDIMDIS